MTAACNHQWSTWKFQARSSAETRWRHACNTTEDQPRARNYQELPAIVSPSRLRTLPPCPSCKAKQATRCTNSHGDPVYSRIHQDRDTAAATRLST